MSQTYSIACKDCRKHIWIGQKGIKYFHLYNGHPEINKALSDFLFEHEGHALIFGENTVGEISEWDEIELDID